MDVGNQEVERVEVVIESNRKGIWVLPKAKIPTFGFPGFCYFKMKGMTYPELCTVIKCFIGNF